MSAPWLSVVIPSYNGADYLAAALDSVLLQEDPDIECIVVDGGSTDATLSILQAYEHKVRLRVLERPAPSNWMASTNYGLSVAGGEYACFLHQDDVWFTDRLRIMRRLTGQFPRAALFLHPSNYIDKAGNTLGRWSCPLPAAPRVIGADFMMERLLVQNFISMPGPLFRTETARAVGGLDETLWYTADWDFWLKVAATGDALYHPRPLAGFRVHGASQTVARSADLDDRRAQLDAVLGKHAAAWSAPEALKHKVSRAARFSNEVNTSLAGAISGKRSHLPALLIPFLALGPAGQFRYLRDSRIWERASARWKARLLASPAAQTAQPDRAAP